MNPFLPMFGLGVTRDGSVTKVNIRSDSGHPSSLKIKGMGCPLPPPSLLCLTFFSFASFLPRAPGHAFFLLELSTMPTSCLSSWPLKWGGTSDRWEAQGARTWIHHGARFGVGAWCMATEFRTATEVRCRAQGFGRKGDR